MPHRSKGLHERPFDESILIWNVVVKIGCEPTVRQDSTRSVCPPEKEVVVLGVYIDRGDAKICNILPAVGVHRLE